MTDDNSEETEFNATNDTYNEDWTEANKRIEAAKISTFERFRNRFINGVDKILKQIN